MTTDSQTDPALPPVPDAPTQPAPMEVVSVRPARRNRWLDIALGAAAVVAVAGIAFAAGRLTAPPTRGGFVGNFAGGGNFDGAGQTLAPGETPGPGFRVGLGGGGITLEGTITEVTADHLTLKLASGQTVQIPISNDTAYHREAAASQSDVQSGTQVLVQLQSAAGGGGFRTGQLPAARDITITGP